MAGIAVLYISANSFSVEGDSTLSFVNNRKVKCDCGVDGIKYSHITNVSFDSVQEITIITIADSVLTANLTNVWFGIVKPGADTSLPLHDHSGDDEGGGIDLPFEFDINGDIQPKV